MRKPWFRAGPQRPGLPLERREPPCKFAGASLWLRTHVCACVCVQREVLVCVSGRLQFRPPGGHGPCSGRAEGALQCPLLLVRQLGLLLTHRRPRAVRTPVGASPHAQVCTCASPLPPPGGLSGLPALVRGRLYHCPHFQFPVHPTSPACHQDHCHPSGTSLSQRPGMCLDFRACLRSVPPGTTPLMGQLPGPPLPPAQLLCPGHPEWPGHPLGLEFPALDDASVSHLPQAPPSTGTGPAGGSMPLCGRTPSSRARRSEEGSRLSGEGLSRCPADSASL